jgi:hypothetical protein
LLKKPYSRSRSLIAEPIPTISAISGLPNNKAPTIIPNTIWVERFIRTTVILADQLLLDYFKNIKVLSFRIKPKKGIVRFAWDLIKFKLFQ